MFVQWAAWGLYCKRLQLVSYKKFMTANLEKSADMIESYGHFRHLVKGTNINGTTLLATDYLNHFNEVIMLVNMVADMPDFVEDIAAWTPKTYQDHFRESGFSDKNLAVAAYDHVPSCYRQPFERIIIHLDALIIRIASRLLEAIATDNQEEIAAVALFGPEMRLLVEKAGAIINGETEGMDQEHIDAVLRA